MANKTITERLGPYNLGEKLRTLRLRKSMGLVELGKHAGLSPAMLSKLERGKLYPTLPTLLRISMVFGVGLEHFFTDERKRHVVAIARKKERLRFPESTGTGSIAYQFESLDFKATDRKLNAVPLENVVGQALRYAATTKNDDGGGVRGGAIWRAELAIPWTALNDARHANVRPTLLRFNFTQHKNATGESASWAGPLDFGGDDNFTGLLYLRDR